ncbi:OmpA family protein [Spirosoma sp. 209]|uniref:OmpA family protein n=1 Tax=Spirosoma sp. 209 TaxID=1955701 RepID=UPI001F2206DA|nr:OmpA family protein [Spirosoma sp. 209]
MFPQTGWGQTPPMSPSTLQAVTFEGSVVDASNRKPLSGALISATNQAGVKGSSQRTGADGSFKITLGPRQSYVVTISADGYHPLNEQLTYTSIYVNKLTKVIRLYRTGTQPPVQEKNVTLADTRQTMPSSTTQSTDILASGTNTANAATVPAAAAPVATAPPARPTPPPASSPRVTPPKTLDAKVVYTPPLVVAPVGKTTQLRAIQFVQSKAELLPDAQPALDQLLTFMQANTTAEIELAGHTDNQGDFDENLKLSKQRVDVVKEFLVKNGIAANRISTRGYGPTRPIASNNHEFSRQQNRRVEMIVVKQ